MKSHIIKGATWCHDASYCRSAFRRDVHPTVHSDILGLRLALDTVQPSRAIRSGSWICPWLYMRSACRYRLAPGNRDDDIGLHLALDADPAQSQQENIQ